MYCRIFRLWPEHRGRMRAEYAFLHPYPLWCDILCLPIQLCAQALVKMEAPVQLQTPAHVLQDGEDRSAQQVLCCWLDKPF